MVNIQMIALICVVPVCFLVSLALGRIVIPWLRALKAGQSIREIGPKWHNSKAGTPAMGGIIFIVSALIGTLIVSLIWQRWTSMFVFLFALVFGLIGFSDDFLKVKKKQNEGLKSWQKLALQLIVSAVYLFILYKRGHMSCELWVPFTTIRWSIPPLVYIFFAVFVIVGSVNAVNLTDGIDGLATGVTMPVMAFFVMTALLVGTLPPVDKQGLAIFPAALFGALAGFLVYNFHPAKTFMGDTGSLFLGGAVCGLAFALDMPLILILVGIVYIIETISVILQVGYFKLTHGKRIFKMTPIHHHFEMSGWSEVKIWVVFVSVSVLFCALAYYAVQPLVK